jgi:hypothetical protein
MDKSFLQGPSYRRSCAPMTDCTAMPFPSECQKYELDTGTKGVTKHEWVYYRSSFLILERNLRGSLGILSVSILCVDDRLAGECAIKMALNVRYIGHILIRNGLCNN